MTIDFFPRSAIISESFFMEARTLNQQQLEQQCRTLRRWVKTLSAFSVIWLVAFSYYLVTVAKFDSAESILYISLLFFPSWLTSLLQSRLQYLYRISAEQAYTAALEEPDHLQDQVLV